MCVMCVCCVCSLCCVVDVVVFVFVLSINSLCVYLLLELLLWFVLSSFIDVCFVCRFLMFFELAYCRF